MLIVITEVIPIERLQVTAWP